MMWILITSAVLAAITLSLMLYFLGWGRAKAYSDYEQAVMLRLAEEFTSLYEDGVSIKDLRELAMKALDDVARAVALYDKTGTFDEQRCRVCGCTWNTPCEGGCFWVEDDLCSACCDKDPGLERL